MANLPGKIKSLELPLSFKTAVNSKLLEQEHETAYF